jgi:hypothetical protein
MGDMECSYPIPTPALPLKGREVFIRTPAHYGESVPNLGVLGDLACLAPWRFNYSPFQRGSRFATNASTPSWKSLLP